MQTNYASYLCKVFSFFLLLFFVWFRPFAFLMIVGVQCSANTTSHLNPCIIYVTLAFCCRYPIELIIEWFSSISSMFFEDSALWVDSFCFHRWEHWTEKRSNVTSSRFFYRGMCLVGVYTRFCNHNVIALTAIEIAHYHFRLISENTRWTTKGSVKWWEFIFTAIREFKRNLSVLIDNSIPNLVQCLNHIFVCIPNGVDLTHNSHHSRKYYVRMVQCQVWIIWRTRHNSKLGVELSYEFLFVCYSVISFI